MRKTFEAVEPVIKLLCVLLVFFTVVVMICEIYFKTDGALFQLFSGLLTSIGGALLIRIKAAHGDSGSTTTTVIGDDAQVTPPTPPVGG